MRLHKAPQRFLFTPDPNDLYAGKGAEESADKLPSTIADRVELCRQTASTAKLARQDILDYTICSPNNSSWDGKCHKTIR